jgi:acetyl-CoA carboxylase carboxyl transferase subunit alpha
VNKLSKNEITAWDRVVLARKSDRPKSLDYMNLIFSDFIELHGDRCFADDKSIVGGIAMLDDIPVTVIGQQKGKSTAENIERNFGMTNPDGYRKALRLMKQAEKFNRPVITFIDTPGAYPGLGAEERGQGEAIARNLLEMSRLQTPIICIVIGEGSSGGALALGVGDKIVMLENAVYSILSPEGFASILYKDASKSAEAAENMKITASDLKQMNIIDKIISEPEGGAQNNINQVADTIKKYLIDNIKILKHYDKDDLVNARYEKFRKIGNLM